MALQACSLAIEEKKKGKTTTKSIQTYVYLEAQTQEKPFEIVKEKLKADVFPYLLVHLIRSDTLEICQVLVLHLGQSELFWAEKPETSMIPLRAVCAITSSRHAMLNLGKPSA